MIISKRYFAIQVLIVISIFAAAEMYVRWQGYTPGDLRPGWSNFHPVDTLIEYPDFIVDSTGILVANKKRFESQGLQINSNGFRAPEFGSLDTVKHKILLVGDSYTWGLSARPLDSSFADRLSRVSDTAVINLGIPSTDPAQYDTVCRRYIPQLRPEVVVVVLYLGNDLMAKPRRIVPFRSFYYYTNAGAMMADDGDIYLSSAREAYDYYTRRKFFLLKPSNLIELIVSKSALLSRIYSVRYRWTEKREAERVIEDMSVTKQYLHSIVHTCRTNHCRLEIVLIPELKEADREVAYFKKRYKGIFNDSILSLYTYIPEGNSKENYTPYPDAHLNNEGHSFYAREIAGRIWQRQ